MTMIIGDALNSASGEKLIVFTLTDTMHGKRVQEKSKCWLPHYRLNGIQKAVTPAFLKEVFEKDDLIVYPSALFFQVIDTEIIDYRLFPLEREEIWKSAKAVQDLFYAISNMLDRVLPQYYDNKREIFNLVCEELSRQKFISYIFSGPILCSIFVNEVNGKQSD